MSFTYENQGHTTFLVYAVGENEVIDKTGLGMIKNNRMPGIVSTIVTQMDSQIYIKYNVTAKVTAEQMFSGIVNRKRLLSFFDGVIDAMISAEDFMLDPGSLLLDLHYIFMDVATSSTSVICLPIMSNAKTGTCIVDFFKNIISKISYDETESTDHVAKLLTYLNRSSTISPQDFKKYIKGLKNDGADEKSAHPSSESEKAKIDRKNKDDQKINKTLENLEYETPPMPTYEIGPSKNVAQPMSVSQSHDKVDVEEKEISLMYLLQHYNSANAAAYKAQKEKKKQASKNQNDKKTSKKKNNSSKKASVDMGFDIPGIQLQTNDSNSQQQSLQQNVCEENIAAKKQVNKIEHNNMDFGNTIILGEFESSNDTVILDFEMPQSAFLIRLRNNEKIVIDKDVFKIGRDKNYTDYYIGNNPAVGHSHANIIVKNEHYYIIDMNSKNHTYVNGKMINSNVEFEIFDNDKVRLANEEFIFKIE